MLSGEGNENGERTTIGLISKKKKNFARAAHFSCTFICRCFARQQSETSKNVVVTLLWRKCRTSHVLVHFFSMPLIFSWVTASISHFLTAATNSYCSSSNKKMAPYLSLLFSVALFLFFFVFVFLYIPNLWT